MSEHLLERSGLLQDIWNPAVFSSAKATAELREVDEIVRDAGFWHSLCVVADVVRFFHSFRTWASGCQCHSEERLVGLQVRCPQQGRRLPEALGRVAAFADDMTDAARQLRGDSLCIGLPSACIQARAFACRGAARLRSFSGGLSS